MILGFFIFLKTIKYLPIETWNLPHNADANILWHGY